MREIGVLQEIWRYPVKSMGGEALPQAVVCPDGLAGDRGWAVVDAASGDITGAKNHPRLLELSARYTGEVPGERVYGSAVPAVEISFPDGSGALSSAADAALSAFIDADLRLVPLESPENPDHYRLSQPLDEETIARQLNIRPGEPLPDFAHVDPEMMMVLMEHATPPGTYADAYPLHMITTASLARLAAEGGGDADLRRFRPNLLLQPLDESPNWLEFDWEGKNLHIGDSVLHVNSRTIRCAMPARPQPGYGLPAAPEVSKTLYRATNRYLGSNLNVVKPGAIAAGDTVYLED